MRIANKETRQRLDVLHRNHYKWLFSCAFKVSKCKVTTEDLIQELYIYLAERNDEKLYYADSFNLQYCRSFLLSRFYNLAKIENRRNPLSDDYEKEETPYDLEWDLKLQHSYGKVINELNSMKREKGWSAAMLAEMYFFSDMTFENLAKEINISKSTAFLNVRKVKEKLKERLENPFKDENK